MVTHDEPPVNPPDRKPAALEGPALYTLLVESVRDYAIFALDATGHVLTWNVGAERIKGYRASEIIGRHFSTFYPEADLAAGKPAMELRVATAEGRFEEEGWRVRKDGTQFWASVVITALRDPTGQLVGFAKVTRDLTERREAQQRAIADASVIAASDAANRAKSEFLATMSHELRTPLNAIGGYAELIDVGIAGPVTDEQHDYIARIRAAQRHLLGIITDLLNYSRIEAGQITCEHQPVDLCAVAAHALEMVALHARARAITVQLCPCPEELVVLADSQKVEQIVLNLLSNALKFTPTGGAVRVECGRDGDIVTLRVRDTGPGIPVDKHAAVFEPFVQVGRSLATPQQGTGLGLAISRDLARAMCGDLTLESLPGQGATFTLSLKAR